MVHASCHCGAVHLEISRRPRKLTQCNCSMCRRYGALWAYYSHRTVRVICARNALSVYTWRNGALELHRCRTCGCVTHHERARRRPDGTVAVNARNMEPDVVASLPIKLVDGAATWQILSETTQPDLFRSPIGGRSSRSTTSGSSRS